VRRKMVEAMRIMDDDDLMGPGEEMRKVAGEGALGTGHAASVLAACDQRKRPLRGTMGENDL
jgi:hypothetical protein